MDACPQEAVVFQPHPVGAVVDRGFGHIVDREHAIEERQGRFELRRDHLVGPEMPQFLDLEDIFGTDDDPHARREFASDLNAPPRASGVGDRQHVSPRPSDAHVLENGGPGAVAVVNVEP